MKLSAQQIKDIQILSSFNIPRATIAKHFNISPPSVKYHTINIAKLSIQDILELFESFSSGQIDFSPILKQTTIEQMKLTLAN